MKKLILLLAAIGLSACQTPEPPRFEGYVPPEQRPTAPLNHLPKLPTAGPHRF